MATQSTITIESAIELTDSQVRSILEAIKPSRDTQVDIRVNQHLIAGIRISYKGKVYDASIRNHIDQLRTYLSNEE